MHSRAATALTGAHPALLRGAFAALLGFVAWSPAGNLAFALLLPAVVFPAGSRMSAAMSAAAFALGAGWWVAPFPAPWTDAILPGAVSTAIYACALAAPYAARWRKDASPASVFWRVCAVLAGQVLSGLFIPLPHLAAAGELIPGAGLLGLAACALFSAWLAVVAANGGPHDLPRWIPVAMSFAFSVIVTYALLAKSIPNPVEWTGIDTQLNRLGHAPTAAECVRRDQALAKAALSGLRNGYRVLLLPAPASDSCPAAPAGSWSEAAAEAEKRGARLLLGSRWSDGDQANMPGPRVDPLSEPRAWLAGLWPHATTICVG